MNEGYNANEIISELKLVVADMDIPDGYQVKFTGEQEEQAESSASYAGFNHCYFHHLPDHSCTVQQCNITFYHYAVGAFQHHWSISGISLL